MTFAERVNSERKKKNYTRDQLANAINIPLNTLATYLREKDPISPPLSTALSIAKALEVSLDYLVGINETEEILLPKKNSPDVLLINLFKSIKALNMKITFPTSGGANIISENQYIRLFLNEAIKCKSAEEVRKAASKYDSLNILNNGELIDSLTHRVTKESEFVYGDIDEEDRDYPEELFNSIQDRKEEFERLWKEENFIEIDNIIKQRLGN